ncbi:alpha-1,6-mannosyl-glycoprotein 4-beta-N-acetylglucosaminyltransferase-like [Rhinatrema bivittatum]|uniref:alpha-1,6-mannosyl-glycoprotein 4-beta-N-acetylglucosaminyltransferase-like n=1 Tax=Rhinatrema bivittatum TaxID=194408 RepID=UPI00112AD097|nr:alpha-1,6-mannosyl-glycoprotein 4-beta-N-acetylglucosaminyltransferase-like [Rhinatrema bivittatum]
MKCLSPFVRYIHFRKVTFLVITLFVLHTMICLIFTRTLKGDADCLQEETPQKGLKDGTLQINSGAPMPENPQPQTYMVTEDALDPLPIPYEYLLGSRPSAKRYMAIGISSIKRQKENYLMDTIQSIFDQSDQEELEELLLVIYLADYNASVSRETAKEIEIKFKLHIAAGHMIVISCSLDSYPTLEGLKRNFNDAEDRVKYRSKQNVDYAFLINFCANLSRYYLMLEDDVKCANGFLTAIKNSVTERNPSWTTISFSKLGYIGKLYQSRDLQQLARFLLLFYDEMPCDWLLDHFYKCKAQPDKIQVVPSLFQHMGSYSSFLSIKNDQKDDEFQESVRKLGDVLPASCFTDIEVHEHYGPENVCKHGAGYFWGKNMIPGNTFRVVFGEAVRLRRILILTGSSEYPRDFLHSGYLETGKEKTEIGGIQTCREFRELGSFQNGHFEINNLDKVIGDKIECLQIRVTGVQKEWLVIKDIDVWVLK